MTTQDSLRKIRSRIDTPDKWCKHSLARNKLGFSLYNFHSSEAVSFCIVGAIRLEGGPCWRSAAALREALGQQQASRNLAMFNDDPETTHADVMELFDQAISNQDKEDDYRRANQTN